jgi:hypothetical protein
MSLSELLGMRGTLAQLPDDVTEFDRNSLHKEFDGLS